MTLPTASDKGTQGLPAVDGTPADQPVVAEATAAKLESPLAPDLKAVLEQRASAVNLEPIPVRLTIPPGPSGSQARAALPPQIEVLNISKSFGPLHALQNVSMKLRPATFHALLGENGAGKSTLVKCIMGTYQPDKGSVVVGSQELEIRNPREAHAQGLGMVYQHFTLVENMTVAENLVLSRAKLPLIIDWKQEIAQLDAFMERMPFKVAPTSLVRNLSAGEKQKCEILKQLYLQRRVLILDEPTSVLTPDEADEVLTMLRKMVTEGKLSILIITHKFREVMSFCDEVTVLRQGKGMGGGTVKDLTPALMAEMMMGTAVAPAQATRSEVPADAVKDPSLKVEGVTAENETGVRVLKGVTLNVKPYEIVGIAGVSGNGQRELVQILAGQRERSGGSVQVHGKDFKGTRDEIRANDFHVLPEMPLQNACVGIMSTAENMVFRDFDRAPFSIAKWFINPGAIRKRAEERITQYRVRPPWPDAKIGNLSGGNVQRAVLARELGGEVKVLIAANPCFGLDFKAVADIRSQIMQARNRGAAVLLVSEDLDEILELADRILVMSGGAVVYETPIAQANRQEIGKHMAGH